jgi:hypothetical protein
METAPPPPVRTITLAEPTRLGWRRMVTILFTPFSAGKWFALGFTAWLAFMGENGGGGSFNVPSDDGDWREIAAAMPDVRGFLQEHLVVVIGVAAFVVLLIVALMLVFMWLSSRGKFMFLDNVVHDRAEVVEPWRRYVRLGNSLFLWRLVFSFVVLVVGALIVGATGVVIWPAIQAEVFGVPQIGAVVGSGLMLALLCVVAAYISMCLNDFVVPIMYRFNLGATDAWRTFMGLFRAGTGSLVLYGLYRFALFVAMTLTLVVLGFLTCCCGFLLMSIPYLGSVLLLPLTVFIRSLSLEYLGQFGSAYDVFMPLTADEAPVAGAEGDAL